MTLNPDTVPTYFMGLKKIISRSTADHHTGGPSHHILRVVRTEELIHRPCSEVSIFGVYSTEMIPGEVGQVPTIQFTGGHSAYNVVDDAS